MFFINYTCVYKYCSVYRVPEFSFFFLNPYTARNPSDSIKLSEVNLAQRKRDIVCHRISRLSPSIRTDWSVPQHHVVLLAALGLLNRESVDEETWLAESLNASLNVSVYVFESLLGSSDPEAVYYVDRKCVPALLLYYFIYSWQLGRILN